MPGRHGGKSSCRRSEKRLGPCRSGWALAKPMVVVIAFTSLVGMFLRRNEHSTTNRVSNNEQAAAATRQ